VERRSAIRKRTQSDQSRRQFSYEYFLEVQGDRIRVCRQFFLSVVNISQRRIYYFFKNTNHFSTGVAFSPKKGKHVKYSIDKNVVDGVRKHILAFPTVASHYCRSDSKKQYLDTKLSIEQMYRLYLESEFVIDGKPVKSSKYREVFNTEFNLGFYKPKKDRCDHCEEFKNLRQPTESQQSEYEAHVNRKVLGKLERDKDRTAYNKSSEDREVAVLCFDMEKVTSLPRADISCFYYLRKLNCYNLTAHCSLDNTTYCALWHEAISGRAGNHIASSMVKILYAVQKDHPQLKKIIMWSDSCVPQNRNSVMSFALAGFLADESVTVKSIEQKYSEPGHGNIQEVDAVHSKIERGLQAGEIFSPVSLLRRLKQLSSKKTPLVIMQMKPQDFKNYQAATSGLSFNQIPYLQVKHLLYCADQPLHIHFCTSFDEELTAIRLNRDKTPRNKKTAGKSNTAQSASPFEKVSPIGKSVDLPVEKVNDLKKMFKYMPQVDLAYFKAVLKLE
jgi:hypothetical protein